MSNPHASNQHDPIRATPEEIEKLNASIAASRAAIGSAPPVRKATATPGDGKPEPQPVPRFVPFPIRCLPERVQRFAATVADATGADLSYVALALLSVLGAAIGTTRAVMPKRGWKIFPTVWAILIGRSSAAKSPPLALINEAVQIVEDRLEEDNAQRMTEYMAALGRYEAGDEEEEPPKPADHRFRVDDLTIEALALILSGNPRGVWMASDEAAGWLTSFTRYKGAKGDTDRPRWLSLFDSGGLTIDRKTGEPKTIRVRNAMVGVCGGIQPQVLAGLMTEENVASGLFARMLLAYPPDRLNQWSDTEVPDELIKELADLIFHLRSLQHEELNGRPAPGLNSLMGDAKAAFIAFYISNRERAYVADDGESSSLVKLEAYALRFAHIRHLCRYPVAGDKRPISLEDVNAGITLANWFADELARIRAALAEPEENRVAKRLFTWIAKRGGVTASEMVRFQKRRFPNVTKAEEFFDAAIRQGCGAYEESKAKNGKTIYKFMPVKAATNDPGHSTPENGAYYAVSPGAENATKTSGKTSDSEMASSNVVRSTGVIDVSNSTVETRGFKLMSELSKEPPDDDDHIEIEEPEPVATAPPKRRFKSDPKRGLDANGKDGAA